MFDRYNGHARRVMFFARFVASQSASVAIESEHLLLGLIREAPFTLARLAPSLSIEDLREKIPRKIVVENPSLRLQMPLSAECKRILSYSAEEANDQDHRFIGPEHILLALLREDTCPAARLLTDMDVQIERARQQLAEDPPEADPDAQTSDGVGRDAIHALVDRLPEPILAHVKEMIDRMLSRSRRDSLRVEESTVVKGTFSSNPETSDEARKGKGAGS